MLDCLASESFVFGINIINVTVVHIGLDWLSETEYYSRSISKRNAIRQAIIQRLYKSQRLTNTYARMQVKEEDMSLIFSFGHDFGSWVR